uniref:BTB domain-containing protein n=1 Tax=Panagrolaimus davidi TaxID=227884 RepID=A0A914QCI9_9BILA
MFTIVYDEVEKNVNVAPYQLKKAAAEKKNDENEPKPASKWYEIMSNNEYSDITFISSDNIQIKSHRCVLSKHSKILSTIFKSRESPIEIIVEEFKGEIILAAIDFLYDKTDSIKGKEADVFKIAERYCIRDVTKACCLYFVESVNSTNVCELILIAYLNNFEELKQKCLKILVEKKKEINASKFAELPKNILIDFCTF